MAYIIRGFRDSNMLLITRYGKYIIQYILYSVYLSEKLFKTMTTLLDEARQSIHANNDHAILLIMGVCYILGYK